ncbi:Flavonoid glucosyltransferase, family GT1 [Zostera marina]|uniref:Flavonoid glucosyltransferase, family GT1 n=1 Tax=Zostera marina TaxID=29655 RepID=A0A0K9P6K8_ZOSMR|nr:Flavonoid glucosyltransferase, family GT1 [Zostera marina]
MGSHQEEPKKKHILMLPFMAQGHIPVFLSLANLINKTYPNTYTVTIVSTSLNVEAIRSVLPPSSAVNLHVLPFRSTDYGLPANSENTNSIPYSLMLNFVCSGRSLRPHLRDLLDKILARNGCPPFCIIADIFFGWSGELAREYGVAHFTLSTCSAVGYAAYIGLWRHLPHLGMKDDEEFGIPGFPEKYRIRRNQLPENLKIADGNDDWSKFYRNDVTNIGRANSDGLLVNTVEEFETAELAILGKITGLPVYPLGPLFLERDGMSNATSSNRKIIEWLDGHPPDSVLYVSFGSQNTITRSQMMALASGLEASSVSFLWVVRSPIGFDLKIEFKDEWLPAGFEKRVKGRGLIVRNWGPQPEILEHASVKAFLTHCGWNSVMESLSRGVTLMGWPLAAEQFYNAKMLEEEVGVLVELARGPVDHVDPQKVSETVVLVMKSEKGKEMKRRATELAGKINEAVCSGGDGKIKKGSSRTNKLDDFLNSVNFQLFFTSEEIN